MAGKVAPKLIATAALDVVITVSINGVTNGRLWLHAAPEGGARLLDWHESRGSKECL